MSRLRSLGAALGDAESEQGRQHMAHLAEPLNRGIPLKRRIIEDLRPSMLSNVGLVPALEIRCECVAATCTPPGAVAV